MKFYFYSTILRYSSAFCFPQKKFTFNNNLIPISVALIALFKIYTLFNGTCKNGANTQKGGRQGLLNTRFVRVNGRVRFPDETALLGHVFPGKAHTSLGAENYVASDEGYNLKGAWGKLIPASVTVGWFGGGGIVELRYYSSITLWVTYCVSVESNVALYDWIYDK